MAEWHGLRPGPRPVVEVVGAMTVVFRSSERATLGVELELAIVSLSHAGLVCVAPEILDEVGAGYPDGVHPKIKGELYQATLELITGICETVPEAVADLTATLDEVEKSLDARGVGLAGIGIHPFTPWYELSLTQGERYLGLVERLQWMARRMITQGVHFHVGVRSAEKVLPIVSALTPYVPHFLGVSASSPYWHGQDTGLASARTKVMEGLPRTGLPPALGSWAEFEELMAGLTAAGAIESVREVWWDIRPHPNFGTVEIRMCDGLSSFEEVAALAALAQSLVADFDARLDAGETLPTLAHWVVRENKWRAARYGIDAELVVSEAGEVRPLPELIDELVARLLPTAERLGCAAELASLPRLAAQPSYARQRAIVAGGGTLSDVVHASRRELREGPLA